MSRAPLFATLACLVACATSPARVRDLDGRPLPPYALNDTARPVLHVECDGRGYLVVTDLAANLYSSHFGATYWFVDPGVNSVCERIKLSKL